MMTIYDIVHKWNNFASYSNAKPLLTDNYSQEQIEKYLQAILPLPLCWEDSVTSIRNIEPEQLDILATGISLIRGDIFLHLGGVNGECHRIAKELKQQNPEWKLYLGFCDTEEACGAEWHLHSFCVTDKGVIVEPTKIQRCNYYGVEITKV